MKEYFYFSDLKSFINVAYVLIMLNIEFEPSLKHLGSGDFEFCIHVLGDDSNVL